MAVIDGGEPLVIPNSEGARTTPSIVAFSKTGERLVGQAAKRQAVTNPHNTIYSAKRLIGRKFTEIAEEAKSLPYKVVEGKNGDAYIECTVGGDVQKYAPEQISSMVLAKLKADAEAYLGEPVTQAVITVPAYFNDAQRQATKDAGTIAGLEVLRIINEPTAASLAYGLDKEGDKNIAVFDLGGGTFDVSVLEIGDGVFEVKATNGDTHLGGDNWDDLIIRWLANEFKRDNGIDLLSDPMAKQRLKEESEKAKIALSSTQSTDINLPYITADASGAKHLNVTLSRAKLEQICEPLYDRVSGPFRAAMKDAGFSAADINELVLVGGMTRNPRIVEIARELGGREPHKGVNPDEVVAIGAGIQGAVLKGDVRDVLLLDVTPLTLGIETAGGVATPMIERNTTIPAKKSQVFSTYADGQTAVDVKVLQGERPMAADNKLLGNFCLEGLPAAPRGVPQIEVTFDIDANGILHVTAKDQGTGKDQKITISGSSGLDKDEVERLKKEAELHAEEDRKRKEKVEIRNELDSMVYQVGKQISELGDKAPAGSLEGIQSILTEAKSALESSDSKTEDLKKLRDQLMAQMATLAGMAQGAGGDDSPESDATPGPDSAKSDRGMQDDVVDAEVVEDDKK